MTGYSSRRLRFYYVFLFCYVVFQICFVSFLKTFHKDTHTNAIKILENYKSLIVRLNESSELDATGQYRIVPVRLSKNQRYDITIVSQCSANHFPLVDELFNEWEGPISVAVFSDLEHLPEGLWDMARFMHCYNWREFIMKLVIPNEDTSDVDYTYGFNKVLASEKSVSCNAPYVSSFFGKMNYDWEKPFPVNLLRNVAKLGSTTEYILVIDIDMVPDPTLRKNFLQFVNKKGEYLEKTVFVVPVFEILKGIPLPKNKKELIGLVENKKARPFYIGPCENCHKRTKYREWLKPRNSSEIDVLHKQEWKHPWEPFVITRLNAPNFDERFKQYGYNRVSQLCEIHMAGYDFAVLDNAFLIHSGYKKSDDFHKTKEKEMKANRLVYNRFKFQIRFKYPDIDRVC